MSTTESLRAPSSGPRQFATTHWSVVLAAGVTGTPESAAALEELCKTYWRPLHNYVRRWTRDPHQAEDLTQAFLVHLLGKDRLKTADPSRGRFRSFLLTSLRNFLLDERKRAMAGKRGGGAEFFSLNAGTSDEQGTEEPADGSDPVKAFEREWALALLAEVLGKIETEFRAAGKGKLIDILGGCLSGKKASQTYAEAGVELGMSEAAVKVAVHRLRRRYREVLRMEIAKTVADPAEIDEELRHLWTALSPAG